MTTRIKQPILRRVVLGIAVFAWAVPVTHLAARDDPAEAGASIPAGSDTSRPSHDRSLPDRPDQPNILLVVVDTLGAKHLSLFDPEAGTSPNIDRLARSGHVFRSAFSPAPWTKPSLASIFTGLAPARHHTTGIKSKLSEAPLTLAETLKSAGHATAAIVSHTLIKAGTGFEQGFESYDIVKFRGNVHDSITSDQVTDHGIEWLRTNREKPFLLFLHYFDPHFNYQHHEKFNRTAGYKGDLSPGMGFRKLLKRAPTLTADDGRFLSGLYREEIAYTDQEIGRLLQAVTDLQLEKNTVVILTADHGEEFLEHGSVGHTKTLFDELLHVPLIFRLPATIGPGIISPGARAEPVTLIDIYPTVLSLLKIPDNRPAEARRDGIDLFSEEASRPGRRLFSEVDFRSSGFAAYKAAVIEGSVKLVYDKVSKQYQFFDRRVDPVEKNDLGTKGQPPSGGEQTILASQTILAEQRLDLQRALEDYMALQRAQGESGSNASAAEEKESSPEELEQLRSLGYL